MNYLHCKIDYKIALATEIRIAVPKIAILLEVYTVIQ
jgi:hypothetical protein